MRRPPLLPTPIAELEATPASDVQATFGFLYEELALGAPLPLLAVGHLHHHQVLLSPVPRCQLLVLSAANTGVPRHAAPCAEQPLAARTLRLGDVAIAVVHHHRRAVLEGAVYLLGHEQHGFAHHGAPRLEGLPGEHALAELGVEDAAAALLWTLDVGDPVLDLEADVVGEAGGAEGMPTAAAGAVSVRWRHGVHADLAEEERRWDGRSS